MKNNRFSLSISILFLAMIACNLNVQPPATQLPATEPPAAEPIAADTPVPTAEQAIQHTMVPPLALPELRSGLAGDTDSSLTSSENRAPSGDRFTFGRFERPFNADTMDVYYPNLDIQNTIFYQDETWMYAVIELKDDSSNQNLPGKYGFEIDLNVDGGGDWLIIAGQPSTTDWTTDGVQVWFDTNDDVGGSLSALTDKQPVPENGYETMVFGNGQDDDDVDLAWARISPDDPNVVEFATKLSLLDGDNTFLVGMWAGGDDFSPALFDVNDLFTHEQAGTALKELEYYYPIKEISELDNACRMAIGFEPKGDEPGLCEKLVAPPQPGDPTPSGCQLNDAVCANYGPGYYFWAPTCECRYLG